MATLTFRMQRGQLLTARESCLDGCGQPQSPRLGPLRHPNRLEQSAHQVFQQCSGTENTCAVL